MEKLDFNVKTPIQGVFLDLAEVPDPVFSQKMVGDGYAIDPTSNKLLSPVKGKVIQVHKSRHAVTIETEVGEQILMHVGIDTVNLKGNGFKSFVKEGDSVDIGTPLLEFDLDYLALHAKSLITPILLLNTEGVSLNTTITPGSVISHSDTLFSFQIEKLLSHENQEDYEEIKSTPIIIDNHTGLHARPSAKIVALTKKYKSSVKLTKDGKTANAKSLVAIMGLEVAYQDKITVVAQGSDAKHAVEAISHLLKHEIKEAHDKEETTPKVVPTPKVKLKDPENIYSGVTASNGQGIGTIFQLNKKEITIQKVESNPATEKEIFFDAIKKAKQEIAKLEMQFANQNALNSSKAKIFHAHIEILEDPTIIEATLACLEEGTNAAYCWNKAFNQVANDLKALKNELLAGRANDIQDVGRRVLKFLIHDDDLDINFDMIPENTILIAENLTPSETAKLDKNKIKGFATTTGGSTSHVAILARSLGIPAIVGINDDVMQLATGTPAIIDADHGQIRINYTDKDKNQVQQNITDAAVKRKKDEEMAHMPATTSDGVKIEVAANIANLTDAKNAEENGCDGVGLLRSEFLFTERKQAPTISEQTEMYQSIADALHRTTGKPLVIRTLDVGGDKPLTYLPIDEEENPFLGERGIRVSLANPDIFRDQLKAILSVKQLDDIHIMFPMVSALDELLEAKEIVAEVQAEMGIEKVSIGIMIEVPSAALMAETLAPHVDFFSVGANDLTQYVTAIDRGHTKLAKKADGLNPGVLKLIEMTCQAATKNNIWVGVCGGIASDIPAVPILIGLGVTELSVSIPMIAQVKATVRSYSLDECKTLAHKALTLSSATEVRKLVQG